MSSDYFDAFIREGQEQITELNNALLALEDDPDDTETMDDIFRSAHTLKGNFAAMGFDDASDLAHAMEDMLDEMREGNMAVTPERMDLIFEGVDELEAILDEIEDSGDNSIDPSGLVAEFRDAIDDHESDDGGEPADDSGGGDGESSGVGIGAQDTQGILTVVEDPGRLVGYDGDLYHVRVKIEDRGMAATDGMMAIQGVSQFDLVAAHPPEAAIEDGEYDGTVDLFVGGGSPEEIRSGLGGQQSVDETAIRPADAEVADLDADPVETAAEASDDAGGEGAADAAAGEAPEETTPGTTTADAGTDDPDPEPSTAGSADATATETASSQSGGTPTTGTSLDGTADPDTATPTAGGSGAADAATTEPAATDAEPSRQTRTETGTDRQSGTAPASEATARGTAATDRGTTDTGPAAGRAATSRDPTAAEAGGQRAGGSAGGTATAAPSAPSGTATAEETKSTGGGGTLARIKTAFGAFFAALRGDSPAQTNGHAAAETNGHHSSSGDATSDRPGASAGATDDPAGRRSRTEPAGGHPETVPERKPESDPTRSTGAGPDRGGGHADGTVDEESSVPSTGAEGSAASTASSASAESTHGATEQTDGTDAAPSTGDFDADAADAGRNDDEATAGAGTNDGGTASATDAPEAAATATGGTEREAGTATADTDGGSLSGGVEESPGEDDPWTWDDDPDETTDDADEDGDGDPFEEPGGGSTEDAGEDGTDGGTGGGDGGDGAGGGGGDGDGGDGGGGDGDGGGGRGSDDDVATSVDDIKSVRVDVEQLDELYGQVEQLVTSRIKLRKALEDADVDVEKDLDELDKTTNSLQDTVMDMRLVPMKKIVGKFPRVVRDLSREQGKEVDFTMEGTDVELDRTILDRLSDPLIHILRNAVDHGIEPPAEREAKGKPREGSVTLRARRERDRAVIEVEDDGGGLDADEIRTKAKEEGIRPADELDQMDDDSVYDLIFHPGFSTTEEVTDVSGRGVGMDVVHNTVTRLDGSVDVDSEPDEGTTVALELPVSIAIVKVLFVEVGDHQFGIPIKKIDKVSRFDGAENVNGQNMIEREDGLYRIVKLHDALDTVVSDGKLDSLDDPEAVATDGGDDEETGMLIRVRRDERPIALYCDAVADQEEVVVKPLEGVLSGTPGLSGTAVLGEGNVVPVLDVKTI